MKKHYMKNHDKNKGLPWRFPKIDLKMKMTALFLIISIFQVQANSYAQKTKLNLDLKDASIEQVFNKIEEASEFRFMFESGLIDLDRKITIKVNEKRITDVLPILFDGTDIEYKIRGRQIILTKKAQGIALPAENILDNATDKNTALQQQVSGTVTDAEGTPLPGTSILEKGTTNGVQTDFDGNFSIEVTDENAILVVSYIGFATREISVSGQNSINIELEESAEGLDEVVVVGYGTQKKSDLTGAIASLGEDEMTMGGSTSNVGQAIQGRASGVVVTQNSRAPGGSTSIRIRGSNSISSTNEPLYVVDGFPTESGININPDDIASMEILKDASATAIYGSRGANGVVMITTKRGKAGQSGAKQYRSQRIHQYSERHCSLRYAERPTIYDLGQRAVQGNIRTGKSRIWGLYPIAVEFYRKHRLDRSYYKK